MLDGWPCQSCCANCFISASASTPLELPFSLRNLLAVGTIAIGLPVEKQHQVCDHTHAEDGWHSFRAEGLASLLPNAEDLTLCHELDFLIKQRFLSATYNCMISDGSRAVIRIYLIPDDLCGLTSALRMRKDAVLNPARRFLRHILPMISKNVGMWFQSPDTPTPTVAENLLFTPYEKVRY